MIRQINNTFFKFYDWISNNHDNKKNQISYIKLKSYCDITIIIK
jgi:hypothetical protein